MKVIYKYHANILGDTLIEIPKDAEILHFGNQNEKPCIWLLIDCDKPVEKRTFRILGTGAPIKTTDKLRHIGTELFNCGVYVWHLFEVL